MAVLTRSRIRFCSKPLTIYDCCKILYLILFSLGCSGFVKQGERFISNRKTMLYTLLAAFTNVAGLLTCMYIKLQNARVQNFDGLIKAIIYLEICMSTLVYVSTVIGLLVNTETNLNLYSRIQTLDEQLTTEFLCNLNYEKLRRKHVILLLSVGLFYMTVIIMAVSQASHGQEFVVNLLAGLAYSAVTGGPHLNCYAQMNMAEVLCIRFRLLQKLLTPDNVCCKSLATEKQLNRLRKLISLMQEYHNCIRQINKVYSLALGTMLLHDFTLTTSELYLILGSDRKNTTSDKSLLWYVAVCMILPFYKMTIAPIYCDNAIREGLKCLKIITNIELWFPGNQEVRQIVAASLLWLKDNRQEFLCGTMPFNKQLIAVVYSQIFNYLLILIQFRMTQEMGDQIEKQKNTIQEWIGVDYV